MSDTNAHTESDAGTAVTPADNRQHAAPGRGFWIMLVAGAAFVGTVAYVQYHRAEQGQRGRYRPVPPPVMANLPDFSLMERAGRPVSLADLRGTVWIADFIFTHCGGPCPIMTRRMRDLHAVLEAEGIRGVRTVSISVDPERDTPEVLLEYAGLFEADRRDWWFLTGDRKAIFDLSIGGFKLPATQSATDDQVEHSPRFVLVDQQGRIRGYYEIVTDEEIFQMPRAEALKRSIPPETLRKLLADIRALLDEGPA